MFDTNSPVLSQKQARTLKFQIDEEEGLCFLCSKTKGADQLCKYCTADLHICFCLCMSLVFLCTAHGFCARTHHGSQSGDQTLDLKELLCVYLLLVMTPSRKITLGSSNCPIILASVRKSSLFLSVAPGFNVFIATDISGRPGMRSFPRQTSPNSPEKSF